MRRSGLIKKVTILTLLTFLVGGVMLGFSPAKTHAATDPLELLKSIKIGQEPLDSTEEVVDTYVINNINYVIGATGLVCVVFLIIGAVKYMTAGGDDQKVQDAQKTLQNALIGLALIVLSGLIINVVFSILDNKKTVTAKPTPGTVPVAI